MGTKVRLTTEMGDIELELFDKETPKTDTTTEPSSTASSTDS